MAEERPQTALQFLDAVESSLQQLADFPKMGRDRGFDAQRLRGIRSFPVTGFETFLIFYHPIHGGIRFSRLLHGARDIDAVLEADE